MRQHFACDIAPPASDLVLEYRRHCRVHGLIAVLLPEPIEDVKSWCPERATSAAKPPEVFGGATAIDLVLLPEIPAKLGHIVQSKWPTQLFPRSLLEERRRLQQVARHEKAKLPLGESSQQLRVTMQKGA